MEHRTVDRAFAGKHLPFIYKMALEQLGDAALAKVACKRVFAKVQAAMDENVMPAESVLTAWLSFLTEDVADDMLLQMSFTELTASQPEKKADTASRRAPAAAAAAEHASSPSAQTTAYTSPPRSQPVQRDSVYAAPSAGSPAPTPAAPVLQHAASTAGVDAGREAAFAASSSRAQKRNAERETDVRFHQRKHPLRIFIIALFGMLILINLWFIVGLLCSRGILPRLDLGYIWFDTYVFMLFNL